MAATVRQSTRSPGSRRHRTAATALRGTPCAPFGTSCAIAVTSVAAQWVPGIFSLSRDRGHFTPRVADRRRLGSRTRGDEPPPPEASLVTASPLQLEPQRRRNHLARHLARRLACYCRISARVSGAGPRRSDLAPSSRGPRASPARATPSGAMHLEESPWRRIRSARFAVTPSPRTDAPRLALRCRPDDGEA